MFSPKKKMSKSRTSRRTTHWTKLNAKRLLDAVQLRYDSEGNAVALSHFAAASGEYKGRGGAKKKTSSKVKKIRA